MSDLIRRKDVLKEAFTIIWNGEDFKVVKTETILSIPSAVPERKKGKWSNYKDEHCCSVCHCVVISNCWNDEIRYDYCPYCSADMRGE